MNSTGPLMSIGDAAKKAGIHRVTINSYIQKGYLNTYMDGYLVYYRDVLRASWMAYQSLKNNSGKASKNYGKKK